MEVDEASIATRGLGTLVTGPNGELRLEIDDGDLHPAEAKRKRPNIAVPAFLGS